MTVPTSNDSDTDAKIATFNSVCGDIWHNLGRKTCWKENHVEVLQSYGSSYYFALVWQLSNNTKRCEQDPGLQGKVHVLYKGLSMTGYNT